MTKSKKKLEELNRKEKQERITELQKVLERMEGTKKH